MSQTPGWSSPGQPVPPPGTGGAPAPGAAWGAAPPPLAPGTPWGGPPIAPKPGVVPLRPLGVGEILDAAITYIRRNPRATLGLATGVAVVTGVIQIVVVLLVLNQTPSFTDTAIDPSGGSSSADFTINIAQLLQSVITVFIQLIATGLLTFVMSQAVLGRATSIGEAWARVRPLFWRLIGVTVLTLLIVVGIFAALLLFGIVAVVGGAEGLGIGLLILGGLAAVLVAAWVFVGLSLAPAALVLERATVTGALRRSWALVKGSWWRIFGISLLASILASIISGIVSVPFALLGGLASLLFGASGDLAVRIGFVGFAIGSSVGTIVTLPFTAGVASLLYIDRRMRREGLDLALARAAGVEPRDGGGADTGGAVPTPGPQRW